jgi:hypothetical protein
VSRALLPFSKTRKCRFTPFLIEAQFFPRKPCPATTATGLREYVFFSLRHTVYDELNATG